jgi:hypothetical protein
MEEKRKKIIATTHEEQHRNFAALYPDVVQQVPQYYIASYLGLTPEHLSRMRKKFNILYSLTPVIDVESTKINQYRKSGPKKMIIFKQ